MQIYQKTTHRKHQKLCEKPKTGKITESLANPLLSRDYREIKKKTSQPLFTIALGFHHLFPNYDTSFIEKIRITSCDILKLLLTRDLSFLYCEASRLDRIRRALLFLEDIPLFCYSECSSQDSE